MFVFAEAIGFVACWGAVCLCLLKLLAVSRAGGCVFVFAEAIGCVACWGAVCLCLLRLLAVSRAGGLGVCVC